MHWAQCKKTGKTEMKCFAYKRSSSISQLRKKFQKKKMSPRPEMQPYEEEASPLLGTQPPEEVEEIRKKKVRFASGPDGALAWAVAFANFVINLAVVGLGRMSGILYVVIMKKFDVDRQTASYPFSVQQATRNLFGPLTGILGQKYGVRNVTVAGGIIGVISAVTCFFAMDMNWITVMWGLVFGICTALTTTLNQVPIDKYFEKHRTTAGGLAFSGGCVGAFFFPVVLEQLINHYGLRGTFLAMGAILMVVIPSALFLGEPPWKKAATASVKGKKGEGKNYSTFTVVDVEKAFSDKVTATDPGRSRVDFALLQQHPETVYQLFALTVITDEVSVSETIDWTSFEPEPLVHEMEAMHAFYTTPEEPISDSSGSVVDELTHNVREVRIVCQEEPKKGSQRESKGESIGWMFIASKLKDLKEKSAEDVLSYFPFHLHVHIQKVLRSLKALSDEMQAGGPPDHMEEEEKTPHQMQVRKIVHSMETLKFQVQDLANNTRSDSGASNEENDAFLRVPYMVRHLKKDIRAMISDTDATDEDESYRLKSKLQVVKVLQSVKSLSDQVQTLVAQVNTSEGQPNSKGTDILQTMKTLDKEITDLTNHTKIKTTVLSEEQKQRNDNSFLHIIKTALIMHKNPLFLLICICRGVFMLTFIPMVTIVVDFAVDQGIRHASGKYIIATLSLGDLLGRLCLGWVTDSGCVSLSRYMVSVMLLLGASTATLPFMTSEVSLMPAMLVFGMLQGSLFVRHQSLVSVYMQEHEQAIGMGFINLLSGFLGLSLPYYIGYFRDTRGSYNDMLYVNGIICAFVGLLWVFEPYFVRYTPRGRQEKYEELVRGTDI